MIKGIDVKFSSYFSYFPKPVFESFNQLPDRVLVRNFGAVPLLLETIKGPEEPKKEAHECVEHACGISVSTYAVVSRGGETGKMGEPICDHFILKRFTNRILACVTDGCGWGNRSRDAAVAANDAFIMYLEQNQMNTHDLKSVGLLLLNGLLAAHTAIFENHDMEEVGTTTILGGILLELEDHNESPCSSFWGFVCLSLGDCKAFLYSSETEKVYDITKGNRGNTDSPTDPGGRLGPQLEQFRVNPGPDLRNLRLYFTRCKQNDIIMLASDGVHDNFDAQQLGYSPKELLSLVSLTENYHNLRKSINLQLDNGQLHNIDDWNTLTSVAAEELKTVFRAKLIQDILSPLKRSGVDNQTQARLTPADITRALIDQCFETTTKIRSLMEGNPTVFLPGTATKELPGKMDHTTCLSFRVVGEESKPKPAQSKRLTQERLPKPIGKKGSNIKKSPSSPRFIPFTYSPPPSELVVQHRNKKLFKGKYSRLKDLFSTTTSSSDNNWLKELQHNSSEMTELTLSECSLTKKLVKALGEALVSNTFLQFLDLSNQCIRDEGAKYICSGLKVNNGLTALNLSGNILRDEGFKFVAGALKVNSTLLALDLTNNEATSKGLNDLYKRIKENSSLTAIRLSDEHGFQIKSVKSISCTDQRLHRLNVPTTNLASNSCPTTGSTSTQQIIASILRHVNQNQMLKNCKEGTETELVFCSRNLTAFLPVIFKFDKLRLLDLSVNKISVVPGDIENLHCLEELVLEENEIKELPVELITLRYLRVLCLRGNRIAHLPTFISLFERLDVLDVDKNAIKEISPALGCLPLLRKLRIANNNLQPTPQFPRSVIEDGNKAILEWGKEILTDSLVTFSRTHLVMVSCGGDGVFEKEFQQNGLFAGMWPAKVFLRTLRKEGEVIRSLPRPATARFWIDYFSWSIPSNSGKNLPFVFHCWDYFQLPKDPTKNPFRMLYCPKVYVIFWGIGPCTHRKAIETFFQQHLKSTDVLLAVGIESEKVKQKDFEQWVMELKQKYPNLKYKWVNCTTGEGLVPLKQTFLKIMNKKITLSSKTIPNNFLALEYKLMSWKEYHQDHRYLSWDLFYRLAVTCNILPEKLPKAIGFLQENGCIFYYRHLENEGENLQSSQNHSNEQSKQQEQSILQSYHCLTPLKSELVFLNISDAHDVYLRLMGETEMNHDYHNPAFLVTTNLSCSNPASTSTTAIPTITMTTEEETV